MVLHARRGAIVPSSVQCSCTHVWKYARTVPLATCGFTKVPVHWLRMNVRTYRHLWVYIGICIYRPVGCTSRYGCFLPLAAVCAYRPIEYAWRYASRPNLQKSHGRFSFVSITAFPQNFTTPENQEPTPESACGTVRTWPIIGPTLIPNWIEIGPNLVLRSQIPSRCALSCMCPWPGGSRARFLQDVFFVLPLHVSLAP